eukprot:jgi/Mesvir1/13880/Mv16016-RA.1
MGPSNREEKARELFSAREYAEAADEYAQLAEEEPHCAKWHTNRAKCLYKLDKHMAALIVCKRSVLADKAWSRGYEIAAQCLLALQRSQEAEDVLVEGMQAAPSPALRKLLPDARAAIHSQPSGPQCNVPPLPRAFKFLPDESGYTPPHPGGRADIKTPDASARRRRLEWGQGLSRDEQVALLDEEERAAHLYDERQKELSRALELEKAWRFQEAIALYEREAEAGCTAAMAALASIYMHGEGVPPDEGRGIAWARRCIQECPAPEYRVLGVLDRSGATCQGFLSMAYHRGLGGLDKDPVQAERLTRMAAEGGNPEAMTEVAMKLQRQGRPPEEYVAFYRCAASLGVSVAMVNLAAVLLQGSECGRDANEAIAWLHKAAEAGEVIAVKGLVEVANKQPGPEGIRILEAARRHAQALRAREEGSKEGVQGPTLALEGGICLDIQRLRDTGMSQDELLGALAAAGDATPSFVEYRAGRAVDTKKCLEYREWLMERLSRVRKPTALEQEAAQLAERAGKLGLMSLSSPGAGCPDQEIVPMVLVAMGLQFLPKGMEAEAHTRFLLPAAKMGFPDGCFLAGRYMATRAKSGKDLRMAQRLLSQAAAKDVPGAQGELDALTRRLARGNLGSAEDDDGGSGGHGASDERRAASASMAPGTSSTSTANQGTASGSGESGGSKAAGSTIASGASAGCDDEHVPAGSSKARTIENLDMVGLLPGVELVVKGIPLEPEVLFEVMGLLASVLPSVEATSRLISGGLPVHLPMLELYVRSHCGSYTGWGMLYSCRHFMKALAAIVRKDYAAALTELYYAYMFDDNVPCIPSTVNVETGEVAPLPGKVQGLFEHVSRVLEKGPPPASSSHNASHAGVHAANRGGGGQDAAPSSSSAFFQAAMVQVVMARDLRDRIRLADLAIKAAPRRMVPALLCWRGVLCGDRIGVLADLDAAAKLLRTDASTSLWPYDPPELAGSSGEMAKFREMMACTLEYRMARLMYDRPADAIAYIKRFQQKLPADTDGLAESYFTLCMALRALGPLKGEPDANPVKMLELLGEVGRVAALQVPVFRPLRPEDIPQFKEVRDEVATLKQVWKEVPIATPPNAGPASGSELRRGREKVAHGISAAGLGIAGAGQAVPSASGGSTGDAAAVRPCWGCEAKMPSLRRCGGCRLAGYCSRECQKKHWKEGHREACAKLAS